MKNIGETSKAELIVRALLHEEENIDAEAEAFMRDVGSVGGEMIILKDMDMIEDELDQFRRKVLKRTAQLMPHLVERGIVKDDQAHVVAKLVMWETAVQDYDVKKWHPVWQKAWRRIRNVIRSSLGW